MASVEDDCLPARGSSESDVHCDASSLSVNERAGAESRCMFVNF